MNQTTEILQKRYPAKAHAARVAEHLGATSGILFLEGQKTRLIEDNDEPVLFRQRRYFFYLSGCLLADSALAYNIATKYLTLFIPPIDTDSVIVSSHAAPQRMPC